MATIKNLLTLLGLLLTFSCAHAEEPAKVDEAFAFQGVKLENGQPVARWRILDRYYLYRDRLKFDIDRGVVVPQLPEADIKDDPIFGKTPVYHQTLAVPLKIDGAAGKVTLTIRYQGCWEGGVCYPPQTRKATLTLPEGNAANAPKAAAPIQPLASAEENAPPSQGSPAKMAGKPSSLSALAELITPPEAQGQDPLPVEQAFRFTSEREGDRLILRWTIAPRYYLYRDRIQLKTLQGDLKLPEKLPLPPAEIKEDPIFGKTPVYHDELNLPLPVSGSGQLEVRYQGCWEGGVCYPPVTKTLTIGAANDADSRNALPPARQDAADAPTTSTGAKEAIAPPQPSASDDALSETDRIAATLRHSGFWAIIGIFFLFGLLLAFTPCVFPMIPILSSIIVGQGENITTRRAFTLSLVYVLAMAVAYTIAGVLAGLFGANLQAALQNPWALGAFSLAFVALALSMFGFYELQLPASLQTRLNALANRQQGGTLAGVAIMGALSALIVGPCVAPPLAGALIYIGQTGDAALGGAALFAMSLGMGLPLIIAGTLGGKYLPRAGGWMDAVKAVFGVVMLALALWIAERILPAWLSVLGWAALAIASGVYLGALEPVGDRSGWRKLWKALGVMLLAWGVLLLIGLARGTPDPLTPLKPVGVIGAAANAPTTPAHALFEKIDGWDELQARLGQGKPVLLDFYADWCVSCKEMERFTFSDPQVQALMKRFVALQADVTDNLPEHKALMKKLGVIGPPAIIFFDPKGNEIKALRVVGTKDAEEFSALLRQALESR